MEFEEIYKQYFKDVYLFILSMSKNPDIAEDITQDTFLKALKYMHKFNGKCSIKSWLCQIGKNAYLSYLKKHKASGRETYKEPTELKDAETIYIEKEDNLSIYRVLDYLEQPYKEVFILRVLGELSFFEIGEIFQRKEGWARVTFHRAKIKVKELWNEKRKGECEK